MVEYRHSARTSVLDWAGQKNGLASDNQMDARGTIAVKKAIHKMGHAFARCVSGKNGEGHTNRANIGTPDVR
jgi:hypothetical protein